MDHILALYLSPPEYLFNFDESTAIKARSPAAPDLPVQAGAPRLEEFEYDRHGTTDLLAFLRPKTGEIFARCTPNHTSQTLIGVFEQHVRTLPSDAELHYIMDNLTTHFTHEFCQRVAEWSGETYRPLPTGKQRRQWLQSTFHGSWLNMVEIWFGILHKRCLQGQAFDSVPHLQEIIVQFVETWNQYFAHPFTWKYTGEGLQEKAVRRFNKLLLIESAQMGVKFLTKQLLLMANIMESSKTQKTTAELKRLYDLMGAKRDYVRHIMTHDTTDRQKKKVDDALDRLNALLMQAYAPEAQTIEIINCQHQLQNL
jgi:hypothetical protein